MPHLDSWPTKRAAVEAIWRIEGTVAAWSALTRELAAFGFEEDVLAIDEAVGKRIAVSAKAYPSPIDLLTNVVQELLQHHAVGHYRSFRGRHPDDARKMGSRVAVLALMAGELAVWKRIEWDAAEQARSFNRDIDAAHFRLR